MDELDRAVVESVLRVAVHSKGLDSIGKALHFLRRSNRVSNEVLLDHADEVLDILNRVKDLPPSPPASGVDPAEPGNAGDAESKDGGSAVPPYDRDVSCPHAQITAP